jgi:BlaI family penicillinase repressor
MPSLTSNCGTTRQLSFFTSTQTSTTVCSATMFGGKKNLSNLEHLVMEALWKRGPSSAEDIRSALEKRHFMKESTARTILKRLEDKGYVRHRVEGRTNIYSGVEARANVAARAVRRVIDTLYGGSVEELLVGMVDSEVIDGRELADLARKVARRRSGKES